MRNRTSGRVRRLAMTAASAAALAILAVQLGRAQTETFSIEQALSAPFCSELRAAPIGRKFAWVANLDGRRNIWVSEPTEGGRSTSRQVTRYTEDDGQEISAPQWTADGLLIVYVRGG